jgi:antitoxin component of MazEF toxin-antitoxin module
MPIRIKRSEEDVILLPAWHMSILNLTEGSEVKAIIENQSLRLARLDRFLDLRGALANDTAFDAAMEEMDRAWQQWTPPAKGKSIGHQMFSWIRVWRGVRVWLWTFPLK